MNETHLLDMLGKTGDSAPQAAPRKKAREGDFASQFMAMLFDDSASEQVGGEGGIEPGKAGEARAGRRGAAVRPESDEAGRKNDIEPSRNRKGAVEERRVLGQFPDELPSVRPGTEPINPKDLQERAGLIRTVEADIPRPAVDRDSDSRFETHPALSRGLKAEQHRQNSPGISRHLHSHEGREVTASLQSRKEAELHFESLVKNRMEASTKPEFVAARSQDKSVPGEPDNGSDRSDAVERRPMQKSDPTGEDTLKVSRRPGVQITAGEISRRTRYRNDPALQAGSDPTERSEARREIGSSHHRKEPDGGSRGGEIADPNHVGDARASGNSRSGIARAVDDGSVEPAARETEPPESSQRSEGERTEGPRHGSDPIRPPHPQNGHSAASMRGGVQFGPDASSISVTKGDLVGSSIRAATSHSSAGAAGAPDFGKVVNQIVETARLQRSGGLDRFTVQLKPDFLGKIVIETELSDDASVRAVIRVADPSVRKAVETGLGHLLGRLHELGLEIASAKVSDFPAQNQEQGQQHSGSDSPRSGSSRSRVSANDLAVGSEVEEGFTSRDDGSLSYFA